MDKDPRAKKLALQLAERLAEGLLESIEREKNIEDGHMQDAENTPRHIIDELQGIVRFLD